MAIRLVQNAPYEDSDLVRETLEGNQLSFQLLIERYEERLFAHVRHYTRNPVEIEDIVQDALLKAYARLDSFQHQSSFYTWLYRITTNTVLDFLKRRGRCPVQAVEDPELEYDPAADDVRVVRPDARLDEAETCEVTHELLNELPEIFRTALIMRELEGLSYQEIADTLEISLGTVESRIYRARNHFKQKLIAKYPEFAPGVDES